MVAETDAEGNAKQYQYDNVNRLIAVVDELDGKTTYTYDALDNIAKVTDVLRQVTSYTYDKNGNQSPGNTSNTFVYDTSDIRVVVNSNGDVITVILNRVCSATTKT